jgi:23S rRNA (guanosine2251-2'-O)-methyltransferase
MRKWTMNELGRISPEDFKASEKHPVAVVLDNVRSLNNVGSAFRTGDAFKIEQLILCGITGTPPNREIHKTALGATESVEWFYDSETTEAIQILKAQGYQIWAIEQAEGSIYLQNFKPNAEDKIAFVFGNEVDGVTDEVLALCDGCIEIPQFGTKHSLNVSVTIGIVLWDYVAKTYKS